MKGYWTTTDSLFEGIIGYATLKVYLASEVDAERAKDREETESLKRKNELLIQTIEHSKEEIARLKKGEEQLSETATLLAVEIARLRRALEFYGNVKNYKPDLKLLYTPLIYDDYGKIAREALEGK